LCPLSTPQPNPNKPDKMYIPCTLTYSFIAFCVEYNAPVEVRFQRTSTQVAQSLITQIQARGMCRFAFKMGRKQEKKGGYSWFIPVIQSLTAETTDPAWLAAAQAMIPGGDGYDEEVLEAV
jgi:hypothetical protein